MSRIPANAIQWNPVALPNIHTWKSSPETLSLQYVYSVRISPKTGPWCLPYTSLMLLSCLPYVFWCRRMSLICFPCVPNNITCICWCMLSLVFLLSWSVKWRVTAHDWSPHNYAFRFVIETLLVLGSVSHVQFRKHICIARMWPTLAYCGICD